MGEANLGSGHMGTSLREQEWMFGAGDDPWLSSPQYSPITGSSKSTSSLPVLEARRSGSVTKKKISPHELDTSVPQMSPFLKDLGLKSAPHGLSGGLKGGPVVESEDIPSLKNITN